VLVATLSVVQAKRVASLVLPLLPAREPSSLCPFPRPWTCPWTTAVAMEPGLRFAIREGGRTVGAGVVAEVID
jgi:elongation factor Tu